MRLIFQFNPQNRGTVEQALLLGVRQRELVTFPWELAESAGTALYN